MNGSLASDGGSANADASRPNDPWTSFVAGEENRLVVSALGRFVDDAVLSAAQRRDERELAAAGDNLTAGTFVLHGPSGTGKTLLVDGLMAAWTARLAHDAVVRLAGSEWAEQYAEAVERDEVETFRRRYRTVDLLVVEDAGRLATKPQAQWELMHTLDAPGANGCSCGDHARCGAAKAGDVSACARGPLGGRVRLRRRGAVVGIATCDSCSARNRAQA
ncbi:MAG: DnaA/Hda family protein [Pirellulales bacterium]